MNIDRAVFAFAGTMVLLSLVLALWVSPYWLLFTAFVGANMLQSAFTGFCPAAAVFRKLGFKAGCAFACGSPLARCTAPRPFRRRRAKCSPTGCATPTRKSATASSFRVVFDRGDGPDRQRA